MKHELVCRLAGRGLAFGMGLCLAVFVLGGGQALAGTSSAKTDTADQPSVAIEPAAAYQAAVADLSGLGIAGLAGDPSFQPTDIASREELAVYLARALQLPAGQTLQFDDVGAAAWGYGEIGPVCDVGLMQGTAAAAFSPDAPVSREQAIAIILAALQYSAQRKGTTSLSSLSSSDVNTWLAGFQDRDLIDPQYSDSVALAYCLGLFDAPAQGWLLPKLAVTHQELIGLVERAFGDPAEERATIPTPVAAVAAYPKLSRGSTGPLVLLLQQRLNALSCYCGNPDGTYSSHTRDAVYAFEKYERLKRTGYVDAGVWKLLFTAAAPAPVYYDYGDTGPRVEVDLTRQILMLVDDNQVVMTVHVSTGKHGTPTNNWHIRTLGHGWHMCSLGPIYSPCYFSPRDAIHGYPSVPTYPASHGCVRTPMWVQDTIVSRLRMGELVHVFYNSLKKTS